MESAGYLEEGNRIFGAALERSLVEQDVDIVQQHAVNGRHVELVLFALLAATLQACGVCLYDDADQEMDGHRLVGETDQNAVGVIAYMLFKSGKLALKKPGEVTLVF